MRKGAGARFGGEGHLVESLVMRLHELSYKIQRPSPNKGQDSTRIRIQHRFVLNRFESLWMDTVDRAMRSREQ